MHELAARLLKTIRKQGLIKPGDRVAAAVSGGADSVALLLLLLELRAELGIVLSVVHVNHKLRGAESDEDERFVTGLAQEKRLELHWRAAPVRADQPGIEAAARKIRYQSFREIARSAGIRKIVTAHTLDDQAETVLLRMARGAGLRGIAGILPRWTLDEPGNIEVVRPLLGIRRSELEQFLSERGQSWREDSTNRDLGFLRNRVRHTLLPLFKQTFQESAIENLADLAEIARAEEEHWKLSHPEILRSGPVLPLADLRSMPLAAQRRIVREWLAQAASLNIPFRTVEQVLDLANDTSGNQLELSAGRAIRRMPKELRLESSAVKASEAYEYRLNIPGQVDIGELGSRFEARLVNPLQIADGDRLQLLDATRIPPEVCVRNWQPGDRFWPAHTKSGKKVKELLADRHIAGAERKLWPVIVAQGLGVVWLRGFPVPSSLWAASGSSQALWIVESAPDK
jgi:tRNA(Ile)-lysidine synthase